MCSVNTPHTISVRSDFSRPHQQQLDYVRTAATAGAALADVEPYWEACRLTGIRL
jgi:hypothetical protein